MIKVLHVLIFLLACWVSPVFAATTFAPGPAAVAFEVRGVKFYWEYLSSPMFTWEWGVVVRKFSTPDNGFINVAVVDEYRPATLPAGGAYPQTLAGARSRLVDDTVKVLNEAVATHAPVVGTPAYPDPQRQATHDYLKANLVFNPTTGAWSKK